MNSRHLVYVSSAALCLILTSGCSTHTSSVSGDSSAAGTSGSSDTITVTPSVTGTVRAVAGGGARTVAVSFNTSDGKPIASLRVTSDLAALPSGWSAPAGAFSCASVKTGNGCILDLTFAPTGGATGTLNLAYTYTNNAGSAETGTVSIAYAATPHDNVVATPSPSGQIGVLVSASRALNVNFTTDDGTAATALRLTTPLGSLPSGWSSTAASFSCATISTGNGCQLPLSFAPSTVVTGTLALTYAYTDNVGAAQTGSVSIPYAGTTHNNAISTASPSGQVGVLVSSSEAVSVNFTTDDGNPATALTLTTPLSGLPTGWSSTATNFSCATISTGNGCQLPLSFAPSTVSTGTLTLTYGYTDNAGAAQTGSVSIAYSSTAHDNVVATPSTSGQVGVLVSASQSVNINFTTDDGNPATALTLTTPLSGLPTGWSSSATSFSCATISTGNGCQLPLSFAPSTVNTGTLTLNYGYTDNAGTAQTGSVSIPYAGTTHNNVVATASPTGTVAVNLNATQAVSVTFTSDDGNPVTALSVSSSLSGLPTAWSSTATSFTCASVATGSACQLNLSFAPSTVNTGTLTLNYAYSDNAGTPQTGSVSIPYAATAAHAYVSDVGTNRVWMCSIAPDGTLSNCAATGSGFTSPVAIAFSGGYAFVSTSGASVYSCAVGSDGTLSACASVAGGFQFPGNLAINGGYLYIANRNAFGGPTACGLGSGGSLSTCTSTGAVSTQNQSSAVAFANGFAYVGTTGDQSLPGILLCTLGNNGTLPACINSGSGLSSVSNLVAAGNNIYAARSAIYLCTAAVSGDLPFCFPQTTAVGSGSYSATGGISINNGFAYITYSTNPAMFTYVYGVEVCSVGVDGTLSNCATTGSGFSHPFSVAIH